MNEMFACLLIAPPFHGDQEKAFDRIDRNFMLRVLEQMNFGPSFRSWVRLLYTNIFSRVLVNGYASDAGKVAHSRPYSIF